MSSDQPAGVDLTLTDPTAIVHAIADHLAGRWTEISFANDQGVWQGPAAIIGCAHVERIGVLVSAGLPTDDHEIVVAGVAWGEILAIEPDGGCPDDDLPALIGSLTRASQWFGHRLEITDRAGDRLVGAVAGFGLNVDDGGVEVLLVPTTEHPELPECALAVDDIESVIDWGAA
jgi:hypothetical protein